PVRRAETARPTVLRPRDPPEASPSEFSCRETAQEFIGFRAGRGRPDGRMSALRSRVESFRLPRPHPALGADEARVARGDDPRAEGPGAGRAGALRPAGALAVHGRAGDRA